MTRTPRRVAGCITSIRATYSCARVLTYLHIWLCAYKTVNIYVTVEHRAKVTINGLYKIGHGLLVAAKMYDLQ